MAIIVEGVDAPNSGTTTPYSITPINALEIDAPEGDTFTGSLGFGLSIDEDIIATTLTAGTEYQLALTSESPFTLGTFEYQIFDAAGTLVGTGDTPFTALSTATYFIKIGTTSGSDSSAGDHSIQIETVTLPVSTGPTEGDDNLVGTEARDVIDLLGGNDTYEGFGGNDNIRGGSGNDNLSGGDGNDVIRGQGGSDVINGDAGNDRIFGGGSSDEVNGGADNDEINGGNGNDTLNGDAGDDLIIGKNGNDVMNGGDGEDRMNGGQGNDIMSGGADNDRMSGANGDDIMDGGEGDDFVLGGDGHDILSGGAGDDILRGDSGRDTLIMDAGNDILSGEGGADMFIFNTTNSSPLDDVVTPWTATVTDFTIFTDDLRIDGLTYGQALAAGMVNGELSSFTPTSSTTVLNTGDTIVFEGITEAEFNEYLDSLDVGPIEVPIEVF